MKVWLARWQLEDLAVEFRVGQHISWSGVSADVDWYTSMLGESAPRWEVEELEPESVQDSAISGVIEELRAVIPTFKNVEHSSERVPVAARMHTLSSTAELGELNDSSAVTGYLLEIRRDVA